MAELISESQNCSVASKGNSGSQLRKPGIDNAQSCVGHIFFDQTLLSHSILLRIMCTSITGRIMMNTRKL